MNRFGSHSPPLAANTRNERQNTPPLAAGIVYCKLGGKAGDTRYIDAYLVGLEGQALIKFFFAMAHHFEKNFPDGDWTYPKIPEKTTDMIKCDHIRVVIK